MTVNIGDLLYDAHRHQFGIVSDVANYSKGEYSISWNDGRKTCAVASCIVVWKYHLKLLNGEA
jgi:hypothetical protein